MNLPRFLTIPFMTADNRAILSKGVFIALGSVCVLGTVATLPVDALDWGFLFLLAFGVLVAPRMALTLPRSRFAISFADAVIFLTFLRYGGQAAVLIALVESMANCLYLRSRGFPFGKLMIPTNIAINVIATTATFVV